MTTLIAHSKTQPGLVKQLFKDLKSVLVLPSDNNYDDTNLKGLIELITLNDCTGSIFFETTKRDTFLWLTSLTGPSIKTRLMDFKLLKFFTTNAFQDCSAELLFTKDFDKNELFIFKNLIVNLLISNKPKDRVISFFYVKNEIYFRIYSIADGVEELGPRINLKIEKILEGCFDGKVLYKANME